MSKKNERHQEVILPFSWEEWDKQDELSHAYHDVELSADFGPFRRGEKYPYATVDYGDGVLQCYDYDGTIANGCRQLKVVKTCKWKAIPVE